MNIKRIFCIKNKNKAQKCFRTIKLVVILAVFCLLCTIGYIKFVSPTTKMPKCGKALKVTTTGVAHDIVIDCPTNNSTVGRTFTITGTAAYQGPSMVQTVSVSMDGFIDNSYLSNARPVKLNQNGEFHILVNLNGSNAVTTRLPVTGGYRYTYNSVPLGRHTFVILINSAYNCSNSICAGDSSDELSAPITLNIQ